MPDVTELSVEEVLAISDPGEKNRDQHGPIDRLMINVGNVVAWAFPLLMIAIVAQVFLRGAGFNQAWLDDAQWWIYGVAMLTAFGYAITTSSHVRVDIFHQHFSDRKKARIEVLALGWLLIPFLVLMTDVMLHYAWQSIKSGEGSSSPNGLHNLWILKSLLPILFLLSGLAAYAVFKRNLAVFKDVTLRNQLLWAFPSAVFLGWRLLHYAAYWVVYLTNADIDARRITKEPVFEWLMTVSFWGILAAILVLTLLNRRKGV